MTDEEFNRIEARFTGATDKISLYRTLYMRLRDLAGDCAEFGVYNGSGARQLARTAPDRIVYAFDTYEGIPAEDYNEVEDSSDPPGKWKPNGRPEELFAGFPNIRPVKGRFAETLSGIPQDQKFILVHIDCDYYKSYKQVLTFLETHMTLGGYALVDDYCLPGARRAINEWLKHMGSRVLWNGCDCMHWFPLP